MKKFLFTLILFFICLVKIQADKDASCIRKDIGGSCPAKGLVYKYCGAGKNSCGSAYYGYGNNHYDDKTNDMVWLLYLQDNTPVFCVGKGEGAAKPNTVCSLNNADRDNALRAAIGYILKNGGDFYDDKNYSQIQKIIWKLQNSSYDYTPEGDYKTLYDNAVKVKENYSSNGAGTYYLANFYDCGDKKQPIVDGYETKIISQKYTNEIAHWAWGFVNSEGNNDDNRAYFLTHTHFDGGEAGAIFSMDEDRKTTIPNGFYLNEIFGSPSISGAWATYSFGDVTQKDYTMYFEYDYSPYDYSITYELDGGTNNSANPSTYNVLYGVTFQNPTRTGYNFIGWYKDADFTQQITGINSGANATFNSVDDLYTQLNSRTIGNIKIYAKWEKQVGTLKIKKVKQDGTTAVINKYVTFNVYPSDNCSGTPQEFSFYTGGDGWGEIQLDANSAYSIKETQAPEGYGLSGQCIHVGYLTDGAVLSQEITNKTQCEFDFEDYSYNGNPPSIKDRLELYREHNLRNLLNFNITDASEACTTYDPEYYLDNTCGGSESELKQESEFKMPFDLKFGKGFDMNAPGFDLSQYNIDLSEYKSDLSDFVGDLSSYNDIIESQNNDSKGYCLIDVYIDNRFSSKLDKVVSAGQLIVDLNSTDDLSIGTLSKICYIYKEDYTNYNIDVDNFLNIDEYIGDFFVDGIKVTQQNVQKKIQSTELKYFYKVDGSIKIEYKPNPVYVEKITGKSLLERNNEGIVLKDNCVDSNGNLKNNCRLLGYGIASNFNDGLESNFKLYNGIEGYHSSFEVSIKNGTKNLFDFGGYDFCPYRVVPKIIKYPDDKGNLQLEFRTIDTNNPFNRDPKTNWAGTNIVQQYITNSNVNNSYNRTGEGSLYTNQTDGTNRIILTPDIVKKIREYNKLNSYNDYTVHIETDADGTQTTTTDFFEYIGLTKVTQ